MAPLSFAGDQRANFQPVKSLIFTMGIADSSVFHMVLAAAANDIAYIRGQQESEEVAKHRGIALSLIKKRVLDWQTGAPDGTLVAVALLAGSEVCDLSRRSGYLFSTDLRTSFYSGRLKTLIPTWMG